MPYICQWKPFSLIFSDSHSNGSNLLVHSNRIFQLVLHSGLWEWFLINYKPFTFIRSFYLLADTIHESKCMLIFKEELLLLVETIFLDLCIYSCEWKQLFRARLCFYSELLFLLFESITEIRRKPVLLNFFHFLTVKQFFQLVETDFLWNFVHSDEWKWIFCSVLLLRGNFVLMETIIQIKVKPFFLE